VQWLRELPAHGFYLLDVKEIKSYALVMEVYFMETGITRRKISIYLADPELRRRLKVAAAQRDISISAFCEEAIRAKLQNEEVNAALEAARRAARRLDEKRNKLGSLDVQTWELVKDGRRR